MASRLTRRISDEPVGVGQAEIEQDDVRPGRLPAVERRPNFAAPRRPGSRARRGSRPRTGGSPHRPRRGGCARRRVSSRVGLARGRDRGQVDVDGQTTEAARARRRRRHRERRSCRGRSTGRSPSRAGRARRERRHAGTCRRRRPMSPAATPGPPSSMVIRTRPASAAAIRDLDRCAGGRVVGDVLEDVRDDRVEQDLVDPDEWGMPVTSYVTARSRSTGRETFDGALDELGWTSNISRSGRSVPDSIRLRSSTERTNRSSRWASPSMLSAASRTSVGDIVHVRIGEIARRRADARERRPKVVRDRIEQRALERVTTTRDLGAGRLLAESVAAQAEGHLVGGEREQPGRLLPGRLAVGRSGSPRASRRPSRRSRS